MAFVIATKQGMTRIYREDGQVIAVTVLKCDEHQNIGQRTIKKDGYEAQIIKAGKKIKETKQTEGFSLNDFNQNQTVEIVGVTKGKGFAGTVKRHGFTIGPKSHGSHNMRQPGSIGSGYPQRVVLGRPMPGRLGGLKTTIKTMVESVMPKENIILVRGSVPGSRGTVVTVTTI